MKLEDARVLITGGGGGIGGAIAAELLSGGAAVMLVDRDAQALGTAAQRLAEHGDRVRTVAADLTSATDRASLCEVARTWRGGVNVLLNNAGVNQFCLLEDQRPEQLDLALAVNVAAPMQLCRALLPHLLRQPSAQILNMGSVFGAIGYPGYAAYSATKFAMRGFSEALRRELADTPVTVQYLAPRATRTGINTAAVEQMNAELKVAMDSPAVVAAVVRRLIERRTPEAVVGWPEKLFARLNAVLPRMVDNAIVKQLPIIRRYARADAPAVPPGQPTNAMRGNSA